MLIAISNPENTMHEIERIELLFEEGVDRFHIRKPGFSEEQMIKYLNKIPKAWRSNMSLHGHRELAERYKIDGLHGDSKNWEGTTSRSCHELDELGQVPVTYEFLSPVFDSISKEGYQSKFETKKLSEYLLSHKSDNKTIALGGVDESTAAKAMEIGFDGVAIHGMIWNTPWTVKLREKLKLVKGELKPNYA